MMMELTTLDIIIIFAYLGSLWGVGLWVAYRHREHAADFMLNRRYSWFNIGSSIFATNIGPSFLIGCAAAGFAAGIVTANFEWLAWIFLFLLGTVCAPHYIRMRITTMPEFIRGRFGPQAADFLSYYGLFTVVVMWIGADLFVGGKLMNQILGYPEWQCMIALALVFMSFTVAGGFSAVMVTDTIQAILMIGSMLVLNAIAFHKVGGLASFIERVPGDFWQVFRPADDMKYPWIAIVLGYPVGGFWFWCTDQTIVQRMLGARDLRQAQYGTIYTGLLKILPPFLFTLPGIFCVALQPDIEKANNAFQTMLSAYMPKGMLGLMIAVLFAASVAGVAGGLNAFSTIFTLDIYKNKFRPESTDRHLKMVSRSTIIVVTFVAVGAALLLQGSKKNVFDTLQSVICFFAPPIASVFLLGLIWKRVTATAVRVTLYAAVPICLAISILNLVDWPSRVFWPHFLLQTFFLFVFCVALLAISSLLTKHSSYEVPFSAAKMGSSAEAAGRGAGWKGYVLWAVLAIVMVLIFVGFQTLATRRQCNEIYVSAGITLSDGTIVPPGDDGNPGTARRPFLSVDRARAEIENRIAENRVPPGGISVWLHGGKYRGADPREAGKDRCAVWRSFPGEKPEFESAAVEK